MDVRTPSESARRARRVDRLHLRFELGTVGATALFSAVPGASGHLERAIAYAVIAVLSWAVVARTAAGANERSVMFELGTLALCFAAALLPLWVARAALGPVGFPAPAHVAELLAPAVALPRLFFFRPLARTERAQQVGARP